MTELMLLKSIQHEVFVSICNLILKSLHSQLYEEGLIHSKTRGIQKENPSSFKRLIVLLFNHFVVYLLILDHHKKTRQAGVHSLAS